MKFFLLKILIRLSSLLLDILNNSITSFCKFLFYLNIYFNIYFENIIKIFLFLLAQFLI